MTYGSRSPMRSAASSKKHSSKCLIARTARPSRRLVSAWVLLLRSKYPTGCGTSSCNLWRTTQPTITYSTDMHRFRLSVFFASFSISTLISNFSRSKSAKSYTQPSATSTLTKSSWQKSLSKHSKEPFSRLVKTLPKKSSETSSWKAYSGRYPSMMSKFKKMPYEL